MNIDSLFLESLGDALRLSEHDLSSTTQSGHEAPNITISGGQSSRHIYQIPSSRSKETPDDNSSRWNHGPRRFEAPVPEQERRVRQENQARLPGQGSQPQQQHHQQRQQLHMRHQPLGQQVQPHHHQPVPERKDYSESPSQAQQPQQRDQAGPAPSYDARGFTGNGRSDLQTALLSQEIPNSDVSRRVEQMQIEDGAAQQHQDNTEGSCCVIL